MNPFQTTNPKIMRKRQEKKKKIGLKNRIFFCPLLHSICCGQTAFAGDDFDVPYEHFNTYYEYTKNKKAIVVGW